MVTPLVWFFVDVFGKFALGREIQPTRGTKDYSILVLVYEVAVNKHVLCSSCEIARSS